MAPTAAISFVLMAAAVGRAGPPSAGVGAAVRIQWNAPAGCSDADAFFSGIRARAEGVRRAQAGEPALRLEVHLERTGSPKVHGELRMADDRGRFEQRKVDGGTCDEVVDALSLTVALALGASGVAPAPSSPAPGGPSIPPPAAAPARSPSVVAPVPAQKDVAPPPAAPPLVVAVPPPPPSEVVAPPPPPPADPGERLPPPQPAARRGSFGVALGLGPVAGQVSTPAFDFGGTAFVRVGPRWDQDEAIPWSLGLSATHLRNDWLGASPAVAISWTAVGLTACPGWGLDLHVVVEVCGTTAVGRLQATAREVSVSTPATRSWWSAGPVLRARLSLGWGFTVLVDATAHVPLYRRTFVTSTPDETVARTPTVAGTLGVVVAREL